MEIKHKKPWVQCSPNLCYKLPTFLYGLRSNAWSLGMYLRSDLITTPLCLNNVQCFIYLFLFFSFTSGKMFFFFMDIMWFWSNFTLANEKIRKLYCLLSGLKHQGNRNREKEREKDYMIISITFNFMVQQMRPCFQHWHYIAVSFALFTSTKQRVRASYRIWAFLPCSSDWFFNISGFYCGK